MPVVPLSQLARVFLILGITAFGGPAAHIAMMHEQVVRRRRWIGEQEFGDLLAATNLIPGPNSTEMAIHVGRRVGGTRGFLIAGGCFILPSAILVSIFAVVYARYGHTPDARAMMAGITPVIIALIAQATWTLARATLRSPAVWLIALCSMAVSLGGVNELLILAAGAVVLIAARSTLRKVVAAIAAMAAAAAEGAAAGAPAAVTAGVPLGALTLFFLKVGSILFGSGYVLIAFLRADLVQRWHWLTDQQLLDAIAVGQFTPGPLSTTATFIGYLLAGWRGAICCTIAMFLPAFVFVAVTQPFIPKLRNSPTAATCLDGVVAASLGLMAAVAVTLAKSSLVGIVPALTAVAALIVLLRWRVNSIWLVLAGAAIGLVSS